MMQMRYVLLLAAVAVIVCGAPTDITNDQETDQIATEDAPEPVMRYKRGFHKKAHFSGGLLGSKILGLGDVLLGAKGLLGSSLGGGFHAKPVYAGGNAYYDNGYGGNQGSHQGGYIGAYGGGYWGRYDGNSGGYPGTLNPGGYGGNNGGVYGTSNGGSYGSGYGGSHGGYYPGGSNTGYFPAGSNTGYFPGGSNTGYYPTSSNTGSYGGYNGGLFGGSNAGSYGGSYDNFDSSYPSSGWSVQGKPC